MLKWFYRKFLAKECGEYRTHCFHFKGTVEGPIPGSSCKKIRELDKLVCCRCSETKVKYYPTSDWS